MQEKGTDLKKLFAEARAIHFAMKDGILSYQQAKYLTRPVLRQINITVESLAKKHNVKPKYITFQDLGVNI